MKSIKNWIVTHKLVSIILAGFIVVGATLAIVLPNVLAHKHEFAVEWTSNETSHWHACDGENCGEIKDKGDHIYTNVCDVDCNVCGTTRTPAEHVYDNACDADCNVCGTTRTPAAHVYDNACDADCNVCGTTRTPEAHQFSKWTTKTAANYGVDEVQIRTCSECNHSETKTIENSRLEYTGELLLKVLNKFTISSNSLVILECVVLQGKINKGDNIMLNSGKQIEVLGIENSDTHDEVASATYGDHIAIAISSDTPESNYLNDAGKVLPYAYIYNPVKKVTENHHTTFDAQITVSNGENDEANSPIISGNKYTFKFYDENISVEGTVTTSDGEALIPGSTATIKVVLDTQVPMYKDLQFVVYNSANKVCMRGTLTEHYHKLQWQKNDTKHWAICADCMTEVVNAEHSLEDWQYDHTNHWHVCEEEGCTYETTKETHTFATGSSVCSTCGYDCAGTTKAFAISVTPSDTNKVTTTLTAGEERWYKIEVTEDLLEIGTELSGGFRSETDTYFDTVTYKVYDVSDTELENFGAPGSISCDGITAGTYYICVTTTSDCTGYFSLILA